MLPRQHGVERAPLPRFARQTETHMTVKTSGTIHLSSGNTDSFTWNNPYGGAWGAAPDWTDITTGTVAATAPGITNSVTIAGGAGGSTDITGTGAAAQLAIGGDVLLWGTVTVAGAVSLLPAVAPAYATADFELDGAATLTAGSLNMSSGGTLGVGDGSMLKVAGTAMLSGADLSATNGSVVQLGGLIANAGTGFSSFIGVDDTSAIEIGTSLGLLGAITIGSGEEAAISGSLAGNVIVAGTLGVQAGGQLSIDTFDPFGNATTIAGAGALLLSEKSVLTLGVADSAAIQFAGPSGTLILNTLTAGAISGFAAGDAIEIFNYQTALATGLTFKETATATTLTLIKSGKTAGTLTLSGNYVGDLFHLGLDSFGNGFITLHTPGIPPVQPPLILGTPGADTLTATANNQTLTGLGGGDILNAGTFTGIDFKDTSANLNGSTIDNPGLSDVIDLTDVNPNSASVTYTPGYSLAVPPYTTVPAFITVTDGTHAATIDLTINGVLPTGYFSAGTDGGTGTDVKYIAVNTDAYAFGSVLGGAYGLAPNWRDLTTGITAAAAPSFGNEVTIAGGAQYTDITGSGFAAGLTTSGEMLLLGTVNVGSRVIGVSGTLAQTGGLTLDGHADLMLAGNANIGGGVQIGGGSALTGSGGLVFTANGASLLAIGGSTAQLANVYGISSLISGPTYYASEMGIDAISSIEFGTAGHATKGALTIDAGVVTDLRGTINGNAVVNGVLAVASTSASLAIGAFGAGAPTITGTGTLEISSYDTLTLGGPDSARIQFIPPTYGSPSGTLNLAGPLPTGTIGGFASGDMITLGQVITGDSYKQVGNLGTLTLLDGIATAGSLILAGSYNPSQFVVQLSAGGQSSTIIYAPAPNPTLGTQVSSNSDLYSWTNTAGGNWSNAGNWSDTTLAKVPTAAPGAGNAVSIGDYTPTGTTQIISGSGSAASVSVTSNAVFTGGITISGQFYAGSFYGAVDLANGASISAASLSAYGLLQLSGGSSLTITGGSSNYVYGTINVLGGSAVKFTGGGGSNFPYVSSTISVDAASSVEIGTTGGAAAGAVTIDSGQVLYMETAAATIAGNLVVNGVLDAFSGTIEGFGGATGSITGSGTIVAGSFDHLILNAADSVGIALSFNDNLEVKGPLPTGTISGLAATFGATDVIQIDKTVTGVSFKQTTTSQGTLTLLDGAATVGTLTLAGSYTASLFHVDVNAATGYGTISLQTPPAAPGTAAANTGKDAYSWTGVSGGTWATATNWTDTTTGKVPTTVPGSGNAVTITGKTAANQYTTIGGTGSAASLSFSGNVLLTGQITDAGPLTITSPSAVPSTLALDSGAKLTAAAAAITGTLQAGTGSSATVSGWATLTGGMLLALDGSTIQLGALIGNGGNNVIAVDANAFIRAGTATAAVAGALTDTANSFVALTGSVYGNVVANGQFAVEGGGALFIDMNGGVSSDPYSSAPTISGTGSLSLSEGSTLGLGAADTAAIQFAGPNATLLLAKLPGGTISGFAAGDTIGLDQTVTGVSFAQTTATQGTLTLTNGAATVGTLKLAGSYSGELFHLDSAVDGSSAVITLQTLGVAAVQPAFIAGTAGADLLTATASGQTITGNGGGDTINGAGFTGLDFKDLTGHLGGTTVQNFVASDVFDFTDLKLATASATYTGGVLSVTDGTRSAKLTVGFAGTVPAGSFHPVTDSGTGTKFVWS